jgi:hypothetical protein
MYHNYDHIFLAKESNNNRPNNKKVGGNTIKLSLRQNIKVTVHF